MHGLEFTLQPWQIIVSLTLHFTFHFNKWKNSELRFCNLDEITNSLVIYYNILILNIVFRWYLLSCLKTSTLKLETTVVINLVFGMVIFSSNWENTLLSRYYRLLNANFLDFVHLYSASTCVKTGEIFLGVFSLRYI